MPKASLPRSSLPTPVAGGETKTIACDTIVLAIGAVPVIDLADVAGSKITRADGAYLVETAPAGVFLAGDCAGLGADAAASGRAAAQAALALARP